VCGLLEALDALTAVGAGVTGRLLLVGGGAKSAAYRRIVADLSQRPIHVPRGDELVATGACVQAAAVLYGRAPEDVAGAWGLGEGTVVDPDPTVDAGTIRAAYARAREP